MASVDAMLALLIKALHTPCARKETIEQFQAFVWDWKRPSIGQEAYDILADLAYDLDFFEPDPLRRAYDWVFYGHERMEKEIATALRRLADLGIEIPHEPPAQGAS